MYVLRTDVARRDGQRAAEFIEGVSGTPSAHLPYADLAVTLLDEAEKPTLHRRRVSVFN